MLATLLATLLTALPAVEGQPPGADLRDPTVTPAGFELGRPGVGLPRCPDLRDPLSVAPACRKRTTANGVPVQSPGQVAPGCVRRAAPPRPEPDLHDPFLRFG